MLVPYFENLITRTPRTLVAVGDPFLGPEVICKLLYKFYKYLFCAVIFVVLLTICSVPYVCVKNFHNV